MYRDPLQGVVQKQRKVLEGKALDLLERMMALPAKPYAKTDLVRLFMGTLLRRLFCYRGYFGAYDLVILSDDLASLTSRVSLAEKIRLVGPIYKEEEPNRLTSLASRVLALRHKLYDGCGFYWQMVMSLGMLLEIANTKGRSFEDDIILGALFESMAKELDDAEKSLVP
jgi:hypothetical protein